MSRESILQDLAQWGTSNAGRDALIRRAHESGITKNKIHTLTGISRPTIYKILETPMTTATPTITPAPTTWEWCDHWHPTLPLPLADPTQSPRLGDIIAVQVDGHTTGAVVTREHQDRTPGTTTHVLTSGPSTPYELADTEENRNLIILSPNWVRNEDMVHAQTDPMSTVCRNPLTIRQDYINAKDGNVHWDRALRPVDAPDPEKICPECAEELARAAHHATHRFAVPQGAMYLSATSEHDWEAAGDWSRDTTRTRDDMVGNINGLLQEAAVLGYVEELPRPEVSGAEEHDELHVWGENDGLMVSFVIPSEEAWGWWAARLAEGLTS